MLRRAGVCWPPLSRSSQLARSRRSAQDYPSRPIKLLIHYAAGQPGRRARPLVGQELGERLGQSLIIDNRIGGATMIAVEQLERTRRRTATR